MISEWGPEIKVTEILRQNGKAVTRELVYFADGRGETNPSADRTKQLHSKSQRSGRKLIVKFSLSQTRSGNHSVTHERTEEWIVSKDGKTLKHTTSTSSSSQRADVSSNPYGSPRGQPGMSSPFRWSETRIFKRIH